MGVRFTQQTPVEQLLAAILKELQLLNKKITYSEVVEVKEPVDG